VPHGVRAHSQEKLLAIVQPVGSFPAADVGRGWSIISSRKNRIVPRCMACSAQPVGRAKSVGPGEASVSAQPQPRWRWGNPLHRVPADSRVKGRMGPFTDCLIYPLSPTPLPSPPMLLLGNKSVARSSATCTDRPLAPAPLLIGEGGLALSPSLGAWQGHGLVGAGAPCCFISLRTAGAMLPVSCPLPGGCHPVPDMHWTGGREMGLDGDCSGMELGMGTRADAGMKGAALTREVQCQSSGAGRQARTTNSRRGKAKAAVLEPQGHCQGGELPWCTAGQGSSRAWSSAAARS